MCVPGIFLAILSTSGFYTRLYGPSLQSGDPRELPWGTLFACPVQVAVILLVLHLFSGTRLYQIGLSLHRFIWNVLAGVMACIFVIPFVFTLLQLAAGCDDLLFHVPPEEHPIAKAMRNPTLRIDYFVTIVATTVMAPILEEIVFRGVLQSWLSRQSWGGAFALVMAIASALIFRGKAMGHAFDDPTVVNVAMAVAPVIFILLMVPGMFAVDWLANRWSRHPEGWSAIYGTSLFFAAVHSFAWPSPIPLFFLALGLGYLAYRTQNLVAPIVLHCLFNVLGTILVLVTSK